MGPDWVHHVEWNHDTPFVYPAYLTDLTILQGQTVYVPVLSLPVVAVAADKTNILSALSAETVSRDT